MKLYLALVHHPVLDRAGDIITTAITNLDVHDIARSARTYGALGYYLVSPIEAQRQLVQRIVQHWAHGPGGKRVPNRAEAIRLVSDVSSFDEAVAAVEEREGARARLIGTSARSQSEAPIVDYAPLREAEGPTLLVFGTGWGLAPSLLERLDGVLPAIEGAGPYNHLSVRAAAAITLDRLVCR